MEGTDFFLCVFYSLNLDVEFMMDVTRAKRVRACVLVVVCFREGACNSCQA